MNESSDSGTVRVVDKHDIVCVSCSENTFMSLDVVAEGSFAALAMVL